MKSPKVGTLSQPLVTPRPPTKLGTPYVFQGPLHSPAGCLYMIRVRWENRNYTKWQVITEKSKMRYVLVN